MIMIRQRNVWSVKWRVPDQEVDQKGLDSWLSLLDNTSSAILSGPLSGCCHEWEAYV